MPTVYYLCPIRPRFRDGGGKPLPRSILKDVMGQPSGLRIECAMFEFEKTIIAAGGTWDRVRIPQEPGHPYGSTVAVVNAPSAVLTLIDAMFPRLTRQEAAQKVKATVPAPRLDAASMTLVWDGRQMNARSLSDLDQKVARG